MEGLRWEEKWKPDRLAPLRPGRSGEAGGRDSLGRAGGEWKAVAWPTLAGEAAEFSGR